MQIINEPAYFDYDFGCDIFFYQNKIFGRVAPFHTVEVTFISHFYNVYFIIVKFILIFFNLTYNFSDLLD